MFTLSDFDYDLPVDRIAQKPVIPRDQAKLLVVNRATKKITHHLVSDLLELVTPQFHFVANNTKVFPARLHGQRQTGGKVELLLTRPLGKSTYACISKPGLKLNTRIVFSHNLTARVSAISKHGLERNIVFSLPEPDLREVLLKIGSTPTPPYIKQRGSSHNDYQTIYAKYGFSAAAPTAGLHFTPQLLAKIKAERKWDEITLNVGLGTFLPVKTNSLADHKMHRETFTISKKSAKSLTHSLTHNKLLAIGTTTARTLETAVSGQKIAPLSGSTKIFIYPPYRFSAVSALLTNFHLPKSTLLMMVSAFTSFPNSDTQFTDFKSSLLGSAYQIAIANNYRFFSYGDAMLIL